MAKDVRIPLTEAQKAKIKGVSPSRAGEKDAKGSEVPAQKTSIAQVDMNADVSAQDLTAQDLTAEDLTAQDLTAQDMSADVSAQDLTAQDLTAEDLTAQDLTAQDLSAGDPDAQ